MILKLFCQGQRINLAAEKPDALLNWRHRWITHVETQSTALSKVEIAVVRWHCLLIHKLHRATSFTCTNQTLISKLAWDIMASSFCSSSKFLPSAWSQAGVKVEHKNENGYFLSNYYSIIWCTKKLSRYFPQKHELAIAHMKNRCTEGCKLSAELQPGMICC